MKLGICGTGQISEQLMRNAVKIEGIQIVSVVHREKEKAVIFAEKHRIPYAFHQMDDFLKCDIDTVYIGLPNSLHYETAEKCICAGKHVLVEKPFVSNMAELNQLIRLAEEHDVMILEVNRIVYLPNIVWIKQNLPYMGTIKKIEVSYCKCSRKYNDYLAGNRPNVFTAEYSGGALMDLGVYGLHFMYELFGFPKEITYHCCKLDTGVDCEGVIELDYGKWNSMIQISKVTNGMSNVKIYGEKARIEFDYAPSILKQGIFINDLFESESHCHQEDNFYYFLKNACIIIDSNDRNEADRLMKKSIQIISLLDNARKQCDIFFPADMEARS